MGSLSLMALSAARAHEFIYSSNRLSASTSYGNDAKYGTPPQWRTEEWNVRLDGLRLIPYFTGQGHAGSEQAQAGLSHNLDPLKILTPLARERYCSRLCYFVEDFSQGGQPSRPSPWVLSPRSRHSCLESSRRGLRAIHNEVARPLGSSFWSSIASAGSMYVNNVAADLPANDCDVYAPAVSQVDTGHRQYRTYNESWG